jgi:beta-N-acetylhexosaminidase
MERLERIEMRPFKAAIEAGVSSIMTAHVIFDAIDGEFPVTLSRKALDGILRDRWKFEGVVFSDDMEMKAIAAHYGLEEALIRGANGGIDVFPISHTLGLQDRAIELLIKAVEKGRVPRERVDQANRRVDAMIARYYQPPRRGSKLEVIGTPEHLEVVAEIRRRCDASALAAGIDPTEFM